MNIELYSRSGCHYCLKAKKYLGMYKIPFVERVLDDEGERNAIYDSYGLIGGDRTMPQIVVRENGSERRIGGFYDLCKSDLVARHRACV